MIRLQSPESLALFPCPTFQFQQPGVLAVLPVHPSHAFGHHFCVDIAFSHVHPADDATIAVSLVRLYSDILAVDFMALPLIEWVV